MHAARVILAFFLGFLLTVLFGICAGLLISCNPIGGVVDECRMEAEEAKDECISYYEEEVLPYMETELETAMQEVEDYLEELLNEMENEFMIRIGCIPDDSTAGWDCTKTELCP